MNIEHAKTIQLYTLLDKLGFHPVKKKGNEYLYFSPWRKEKTPSFRLNIHKNVCFDFGENEGGDTIRFVQKLLESEGKPCSASDSLKWLKDSFDNIEPLTVKPDVSKIEIKQEAVLRDVRPITRKGLIKYLDQRGIPLEAAKLYLRELQVYYPETGSTVIALGLKNENRGYELRNPGFKGTLPPKGITFIRGKKDKPPGIHIFEGFMDFLSIISRELDYKLDDDVIILNSTSNVELAIPYMKNYGYNFLRLWLDNDKAGMKATKRLIDFAETEQGIQYKALNYCYKPYKDVNEWHMAKLGLRLS